MDQPSTLTAEGSDPKFPEIVLGLVAPYGTPLTYFTTTLQGALKSKCAYDSEVLHLSTYTKMFTGLSQPHPATGVSEAERVDALMTRGNQARELTAKGEVLALCAINDIHGRHRSVYKAGNPLLHNLPLSQLRQAHH